MASKTSLPYLPSDVDYFPNASQKRLPFIRFRPVIHNKRADPLKTLPPRQMSKINHTSTCTCAKCRQLARRIVSQPTRLYFRASITLVAATLEANGFTPTRKDNWNVMWANGGMKGYLFQGLSRYQKVSHFPRTFEITRKDQLCRNINRMQQLHGLRHFDFIPSSFVLPGEADALRRAMERDADSMWIVKPAASACGRGIFVTNSYEDAASSSLDGNSLVSRYVANPLLLDDRKFDLRIYVGVTSFNPLKIYIYREGLCRLSTEKYTVDPASFDNRFVHLTNYSIQKKSSKYEKGQAQKIDGAGVNEGISEGKRAQDDFDDVTNGHKWSLGALRRRLCKMGLDADVMWSDMSSVIVKTLVAIEPQVVAAMDMFVKHPSNCFQLFGFDILFDESLKPWLIEVNLGPSLACDSDLDLKVKSNMIADLLTLAGVQPYDPVKLKECHAQGIALDFSTGVMPAEDSAAESPSGASPTRRSNHRRKSSSAQTSSSHSESSNAARTAMGGCNVTMSLEERRAIRELEEEAQRQGGWERIFPSSRAFSEVRQFFAEERPLNLALSRFIAAKEFNGSAFAEREAARTRRRRAGGRRTKATRGRSKSGAVADEKNTRRLDDDMAKHQQRRREGLERRRAQAEQLRHATVWRE